MTLAVLMKKVVRCEQQLSLLCLSEESMAVRFNISTLLWGTGFAALICSVAFSLPLPVMALVLAVSMLLSPSIWLSGSMFGTGWKRAFFAGGMIAGSVPHVLSTYYMYMLLAPTLQGQWLQTGLADTREQLLARLTLFLTRGGFRCYSFGRWWFVSIDT
jgi:hypothetical protein